jgi:hypothetical protein
MFIHAPTKNHRTQNYAPTKNHRTRRTPRHAARASRPQESGRGGVTEGSLPSSPQPRQHPAAPATDSEKPSTPKPTNTESITNARVGEQLQLPADPRIALTGLRVWQALYPRKTRTQHDIQRGKTKTMEVRCQLPRKPPAIRGDREECWCRSRPCRRARACARRGRKPEGSFQRVEMPSRTHHPRACPRPPARPQQPTRPPPKAQRSSGPWRRLVPKPARRRTMAHARRGRNQRAHSSRWTCPPGPTVIAQAQPARGAPAATAAPHASPSCHASARFSCHGPRNNNNNSEVIWVQYTNHKREVQFAKTCKQTRKPKSQARAVIEAHRPIDCVNKTDWEERKQINEQCHEMKA